MEGAAKEPLEVPPQTEARVGGRTPIWGGMGLVGKWPWGESRPSTDHKPQETPPQEGKSSLGSPPVGLAVPRHSFPGTFHIRVQQK